MGKYCLETGTCGPAAAAGFDSLLKGYMPVDPPVVEINCGKDAFKTTYDGSLRIAATAAATFAAVASML